MVIWLHKDIHFDVQGGLLVDRKKIRRFGHCIGLTFSQKLMNAISKLKEGDEVDIEYYKDKIIIRKAVEE